MSAPPYQKLFWGSYHKHTAHLSQAREHGAYLLLIGALWNNEGRLPIDDATLAGYAKLTIKEWEAIKPKLINGTLLKVVRGKLTQPRVTEDLAKYRDTSGKRKEAGRAGGMASAGKLTGNRQAIAGGLPTKPKPEPEPIEEHAYACSPAVAEPAPKALRRKPETARPRGFPDEIALQVAGAKAANEGADINVLREAERFRNHARQNDRRARDWGAAWDNWIVDAISKAPRTPPRSEPIAAAIFPGPAALRALIFDLHEGPELVVKYLDTSGWRDLPVPTIVCRNRYAATQLMKVAGGTITDFGTQVAVEQTGKDAA